MKYASIEAVWHSKTSSYSLETVCAVHGVSRQAFYHYQTHQANERLKQEMVLQLVCQIRARQPRIGVRKLYQLLKPQFEQLGLQLGRDALFRLLKDHGLLIAPSKRGKRTTFANHRFYRYPNRITDLVVDRIHQVFVADITYLQTLDGFVYLALVTDLFSRKIVGFDVSDSLAVEGAIRACKMAIKSVTKSDALIHHSDRGIQYCCHAYTQLLHSHGVQLSMTQNGDVYQNAIAERVNGILKIEFLLNHTFGSIQQATANAKQSVAIYNNERPHLSLGYQTPQDVYHKGQKQLPINLP
ncbi:IS3 family transposase [Candidatus Poribacteria bacterium]|nr:IS3 family transposase [Candidatus Poribacteria bacterium]